MKLAVKSLIAAAVAVTALSAAPAMACNTRLIIENPNGYDVTIKGLWTKKEGRAGKSGNLSLWNSWDINPRSSIVKTIRTTRKKKNRFHVIVRWDGGGRYELKQSPAAKCSEGHRIVIG